MTLIDLEPKNRSFLVIFWRFLSAKKMKYDEMDGDGPRLPGNRNCNRLSRVSWTLAQISCSEWKCIAVGPIKTFDGPQQFSVMAATSAAPTAAADDDDDDDCLACVQEDGMRSKLTIM